MSTPQTFAFDRSAYLRCRIRELLVVAVPTGPLLCAVIFASERVGLRIAVAASAALVTVLCGGFAWRAIDEMAARRDRAICLDDDGVWYAGEGKSSGLVTWNRIERIAEQGMDRRVVLLAATGVPLLHIEPWLHDVQGLIARIVERLPPVLDTPIRARMVWWERVYLACAGLVATICVVTTLWKGTYCLVPLLVVAIGYGWSGIADRVISITLEADRMILVTLRGRVVVPRDQIFRIRVAVLPGPRSREPCVEVCVAGRSLPVWLFHMDVGTIELARSLQAWRGTESIL